MSYILAETKQAHKVETDVESTLNRRSFNVVCPLGIMLSLKVEKKNNVLHRAMIQASITFK